MRIDRVPCLLGGGFAALFATPKLALVPVSAEAVVPAPQRLAGSPFVIVFLAVGWRRSARVRA